MSDARTPEQQTAVVRCKFCPWSMPQFRKSDGRERRDLWSSLRYHVSQAHPTEYRGYRKKVDSEHKIVSAADIDRDTKREFWEPD